MWSDCQCRLLEGQHDSIGRLLALDVLPEFVGPAPTGRSFRQAFHGGRYRESGTHPVGEDFWIYIAGRSGVCGGFPMCEFRLQIFDMLIEKNLSRAGSQLERP